MNINEQLGEGLMRYIVKYIQSNEFQVRLNIDDKGTEKEYRSGFIQGMLWAGTLISYFLKNGEYLTIQKLQDEKNKTNSNGKEKE